MVRKIQAIYQNGVLQPLEPLPQELEGKQLDVIIQEPSSSAHILELAFQVYEGLSVQDIDDVEKVAVDRSNFFGE